MALVTERMSASKAPAQPNIDPKTNRVTSVQLPNSSATVNSAITDPQDGGFFGSFFQKKKKPGVLENPPQVLKATGNLSEREYIETEVIS